MITQTGFRFTGRHALALFVGFFAVVFIVNGIFVWAATQSWRGIDTDDAYRKGLDFNETLARADAQRALGWQAGIGLEGARPVLRLRDAAGMPLDGLAISGIARRPVDEQGDQVLDLTAAGGGVYRAGGDLPVPGQWDVRISVARPDGPPFLIRQRIRVPEAEGG